MCGSTDLHSTLIFCPGERTCPALGDINWAEYVPAALELLTNCGAKLSATANMVTRNPLVFIFTPPVDSENSECK
jgi:hypothetical protein